MTPKIQRIGILLIAIVMIVGTIGSFAMLIIANQNTLAEQKRLAQQQQEVAEKQQKDAEALSAKYYATFKAYDTKAAEFDASAVGADVTHEDLQEGDGAVITKDSAYKAYYIGWNPKGKIFDSSISGDTLKQPLDLRQITLIPGWYEGVEGMKIGGVREITIPSDKAYGEKGQGDDIPPNTPIKFIVMAIPA